jgi:hypothetical protein
MRRPRNCRSSIGPSPPPWSGGSAGSLGGSTRSIQNPFTGNLSDFYKLRVGDYRVIYEIVREETTILVHAVGHRSKVYRHR